MSLWRTLVLDISSLFLSFSCLCSSPDKHTCPISAATMLFGMTSMVTATTVSASMAVTALMAAMAVTAAVTLMSIRTRGATTLVIVHSDNNRLFCKPHAAQPVCDGVCCRRWRIRRCSAISPGRSRCGRVLRNVCVLRDVVPRESCTLLISRVLFWSWLRWTPVSVQTTPREVDVRFDIAVPLGPVPLVIGEPLVFIHWNFA